MKTPLFAIALFALTAGLVLGYPVVEKTASPAPTATPTHAPLPADLPPDLVQQPQPRIEAVFVLDTTGSMGGMIEAAKENIWSIASSMAQAKPTPQLAIGLVAFRDRGDDYVTRVIDLSTDLDSVYAKLMDFQAAGGGDHPESVNKALSDAINRISWSQDRDAYRSIFLVGDAPPKHYADEAGSDQLTKAARGRGIVVNTIQAGNDDSTRHSWQQIATLAGGAYFEVGQAGSAVAVTTPYDASIAELSRELDDTRLFYGDADTQTAMAAKQAATEKLHTAASPAAQAKRAVFNASAAGSSNRLGESELVEAVSSGKVDLDDVPAAELPAPLLAMSPDERKQKIEQTAERRREISAEIDRLSGQRQAHIETTLAEETGRRDSLDYRLFDTVKAQAEAKGMSYEAAEPVH